MSARSRWAIGAWLLCVCACVVVISRTEVSADLSAFLPSSPTPAQQILVEQLRDGVVSRLLLIGIEGDDPQALAQVSKRLAAGLRSQPQFASINNGEDVAAGPDREFLWRNRYLLSPAVNAEHFSSAALRASLEEYLQLLGSPAGIFVQRALPNDPSGELLRLVGQLEAQARPATRDGVWFGKDGKRALLVAQTAAAGYDIDAQQRAMGLIREGFEKAQSGAAVPGSAAQARLLVSGPGVFSVNTRERIKDDAWRLSLIATLLISAMLLAIYRSPRVLLLGLLPVASGALAGIAVVSLAYGGVHGITLGFGATLIGEGVDYAIYLFTQIAPAAGPQATLRRIWPTLRLGVITSICGFSAMLLSGFPGLAQLGLFSIAGLVVAVSVTRWVLPELLPPGFRARATATLSTRLAAVAQRAPRLRYPLIAVVVAAVLFLLIQRGPLFTDELLSLSPIAASDRQLDEQLRGDIGAPDVRHLVVITAPDQEGALQGSEKIGAILQALIDRGALAGFESPAVYLPSVATQRARQDALPAQPTLRGELQAAMQGLPFRAGLFDPFLHDVEAAKQQPLLDRAALKGTNLALKVDSLLVGRSRGSAAMLPLRGVADSQAIAREIAAATGVEAVVLDLKIASDELYQSYRREVVRNSLAGAGAIVLFLLLALRSPRRVLDVLAPLAGAVVITTAAIVMGGRPLSIFHLVGLLLVVAVGSNYSLFFEHPTATDEDRERTLVSLLFANVATVIGFGLLSFSSVPVLHAIGSTVAIGAVLSLVFSAIWIDRGRNHIGHI